MQLASARIRIQQEFVAALNTTFEDYRIFGKFGLQCIAKGAHGAVHRYARLFERDLHHLNIALGGFAHQPGVYLLNDTLFVVCKYKGGKGAVVGLPDACPLCLAGRLYLFVFWLH